MAVNTTGILVYMAGKYSPFTLCNNLSITAPYEILVMSLHTNLQASGSANRGFKRFNRFIRLKV